ncbi:restriction endonuclease subunit S [Marivirga harenae]|uniref:restriction endonuclease subunit S n=1 Tax=Marivirga harenae TaxID=2010992 RepID=UPI0026DF1BAA|nr:restriction endonuclease subunit S [Marivirga harenae]WKV12192.1 restriction endonuclease subunit S [Marivirga harenae]
MERYKSLKKTGVNWLGDIPENWEVKKIKHNTYVKGRVGWKGLKSDEFLTQGYSYLITGTDFKNDSISWDNCYYIDQNRYEDDPYIQLQNGDLLITKDGTIGKVALVKKLDKPACLNSGIFLIRPLNEEYLTEYMFWILKSNSFATFIEYKETGSTIKHLYQNVFEEFKYPLPPKSEQTQIAKFLDYKTQQIDSLIEKKERLIELLKGERTAMINHAVTKGLNPDVPMKDSGIEWLGEIPEQWQVSKLKNYSLRIGDGLHSTPQYVDKSEYYFVNGNNLANGQIIFTPKTRNVDKNEFEKHHIDLGDNTLLISINGTIGNLALYRGEKIILGKSACYINLTTEVSREFLYYFFQSNYVSNFLTIELTGTTIYNLSLESVRNMKIVIPAVNEQYQIVNRLEKLLNKLDQTSQNVKKEISLLKEYKTSLIDEAVTGKIDVRDYNLEKEAVS